LLGHGTQLRRGDKRGVQAAAASEFARRQTMMMHGPPMTPVSDGPMHGMPHVAMVRGVFGLTVESRREEAQCN